MEVSNLVQAGGLVHTRVRNALVDVLLTSHPRVTQLALALERTLGVYALPRVLTWVGTYLSK